MTREEAKDYIREWCPYDRQEEIIKAIEQEPCGDCISRETIKTAYKQKLQSGLIDESRNIDLTRFTEEPYKDFCKFVDSIPSVQPIRPKGEWINTRPPEKSDNIVCSLCGFDSIADYKFCPNCGAKMESEGKG